ncbi:MAG: DUF2264 domain-containing protein [Actinomycetota bacterium]
MPSEDRRLSPFTGWSRSHWEYVADLLLEGILKHASPQGARILPPGGRRSSRGSDLESLEGFARTFLLAAFRLRGADGTVPRLADLFSRGLSAGCDSRSGEAWPRLEDYSQGMVEAASIAIALHESRPWIWDRLGQSSQEHVVDWLSTFHGKRTPDNNWHWFRVIVSTFLKSIGASHEPIDSALDRIEDFYRGDGWYSDGPGESYDHYVGWAFHFYALMWVRMDGFRSDPERAELYKERARQFLQQYVHLFASDGAPLYQGRSLIYRFATVAPFWAGALLGASPLEPGRTRRLASGVLRYFLDRGAVRDGLLTMGWHSEFLPMAQHYSGSASPYWASKAFTGLLLPRDHSVWTDVELLLPVEEQDFCLAMPVPGFLVQGTKDDGIVRIASHRTHARAGPAQRRATSSRLRRVRREVLRGIRRIPQSGRVLRRIRRVVQRGDSDNDVHYRKVGYSTHSAPDIGGVAEVHDLDSHVAIVSPRHVSRRQKIHPIAIEDHFAASAYVDERPGERTQVEIVSVAKSGVEFRISHARGPAGALIVRDGGFAIASDEILRTEEGETWAMAQTTLGLRSLIVGLHGFSEGASSLLEAHNPMGRYSATPYLISRGSEEEAVTVSAVYLGAVQLDAAAIHRALDEVSVDGGRVILGFGDGERYVVNLGGPVEMGIELGGSPLTGSTRFARVTGDDVYVVPD